VEELRGMVERIQNDTEQVKKTQSAILSAPTTDESKERAVSFTFIMMCFKNGELLMCDKLLIISQKCNSS
jgi:hypothetical protein